MVADMNNPKNGVTPKDRRRVYTPEEIREVMDEFMQPTDLPKGAQDFKDVRCRQIAKKKFSSDDSKIGLDRTTGGIYRIITKCLDDYDADGRIPMSTRLASTVSIHPYHRELTDMDTYCMEDMWKTRNERDSNFDDVEVMISMASILNLPYGVVHQYVNSHRTFIFTREAIRHDPMKDTCFAATPIPVKKENDMSTPKKKKKEIADTKSVKTTPITEHEGKKYLRRIYSVEDHKTSIMVDVYRVAKAFKVSGPLEQALKKILCCGQRGKGDEVADLKGAIAAINRAIEDHLLDERIKELGEGN
jgi:hypothetical protein